ncbi:MAG TPA: GNAT family protein [Candidatus Polarisedimenticolia bacterium]|jgi:RimJ/RimL family protein N-acetyltransferase|nr:GNAT family protein [Candidatus Polarisedimenticolia bacterium]
MIKISFEAPLSLEALAFLSAETGVDFMRHDTSRWLCATGRNADEIVGVCCFEPYHWFDWHYTAAVTDPRCVTRRLLQALFTAVFSQAVRVSALIEPGNERAIKNAVALGFRYEGYGRLMVEGRRDALIYGMLREDCRYLPLTAFLKPVDRLEATGASLDG